MRSCYLLLCSAALTLSACTQREATNNLAEAQANAPAADATASESAAPPAATPAGGDKEASIPCPFRGTKEWKAWVNAMPGPGAQRTLIVIGQVDVGSDGYAGKLSLGALDKSMPPTQHVNLDLVEKSGAKAGWQEVRIDHRPAASYKAVTIDCHGQEVGHVEPVTEAQ
jgi:hypothetical protein